MMWPLKKSIMSTLSLKIVASSNCLEFKKQLVHELRFMHINSYENQSIERHMFMQKTKNI